MNINRNIFYRLYTRTKGYRWMMNNMLAFSSKCKASGTPSFDYKNTRMDLSLGELVWFAFLRCMVVILDFFGIIKINVATRQNWIRMK